MISLGLDDSLVDLVLEKMYKPMIRALINQSYSSLPSSSSASAATAFTSKWSPFLKGWHAETASSEMQSRRHRVRNSSISSTSRLLVSLV